MIVKGKSCPPKGVTYCKWNLRGRKREVFDCGMYLMIGHTIDGKTWTSVFDGEDTLALFQETFVGILRDPGEHNGVLEVVSDLLSSQLMSFDDWFYDEAFLRLLPLAATDALSSDAAERLHSLFKELIQRGYPLRRAREKHPEVSL